MDYHDNIAIIIPSLDPDDKLLQLLGGICAAGFRNIIMVNDGSSSEYDHYFQAAQRDFGCHLITHCVNMGKGRALKDAFNYILTERPEIAGAITVDSDGQHCVEDIESCCAALVAEPDSLILGCRDFSRQNQNIPARSRFGNVTTRRVLRLLCGVNVTDTQTGLRGFSCETMRSFMTTGGDRFEFETNMLIDTKEKEIAIREVPIKTIYIEENRTSHFNPLKDSLRIYSVFFKFIFCSCASFVLDIALFSLFEWLLSGLLSVDSSIVVAAYGARAISALFNYTLNKNKVFKSTGNSTKTLIKYAVLCVAQISISAFITKFIFGLLNFNVTIIKVIVDTLLFLASFQIQRGWVFKK